MCVCVCVCVFHVSRWIYLLEGEILKQLLPLPPSIPKTINNKKQLEEMTRYFFNLISRMNDISIKFDIDFYLR